MPLPSPAPPALVAGNRDPGRARPGPPARDAQAGHRIPPAVRASAPARRDHPPWRETAPSNASRHRGERRTRRGPDWRHAAAPIPAGYGGWCCAPPHAARAALQPGSRSASGNGSGAPRRKRPRFSVRIRHRTHRSPPLRTFQPGETVRSWQSTYPTPARTLVEGKTRRTRRSGAGVDPCPRKAGFAAQTQTASRLRPLARRALRTARPLRVLIRSRKPCVRLRFTTEG